jgi:hypothetical protein
MRRPRGENRHSSVCSGAFAVGALALTLLSLPFALPLAAEKLGDPVGGELCQWVGGKWGSAQSVCITRACYARGDCGLWVNPSKWCRGLRIGDSIEEVYFQLGNPSKVEGNTYTWLEGKFDTIPLTATIENGVLQSVKCL